MSFLGFNRWWFGNVFGGWIQFVGCLSWTLLAFNLMRIWTLNKITWWMFQVSVWAKSSQIHSNPSQIQSINNVKTLVHFSKNTWLTLMEFTGKRFKVNHLKRAQNCKPNTLTSRCKQKTIYWIHRNRFKEILSFLLSIY